MPRRFTLLICLVAALAVPVGIAHAQSSPFAPLPPAATTPDAEPTVTSATSTTSDDGGLKSWQQILIFAGGGILLLGIAWAIVTDARSHAPVKDDTEEQHESRLRKEEDIKRRKAKNRAATKRSRQARKRNR
ncbi:hypothetical protein DSM104299_02900 [Baekduia alba]|uniref:hypothetical protein n=1 Tax=Baekduia alba TaxID=2997333 RepID=UPI00233FA258|nr:hypothetical protein [Baekduia alba]WCB94171.1 hypothetical protein DSM104299_02900 [Baekduia alba]